ncbi:hypothetical protein R5R35_007861 [Gryllus longicercus]|uniref:BUB1 N-terminal domain-containing protein n=1 Tax=Gryllus longicercus TaxID=2509291 RepID=A0AAN9VGH1_9ORTH
MELLDESKENIQPLRRGRNISTLNTALQAQTDAEIHHQLMKEREEFEILVRSYAGDDPLQPWYEYVLWVEQNFPKHGREGNLKTLLENCLLQFKDNEQYSQDVRYIDLWTRYMSFADDPLGMYKQIHAKGIGAQCAIFYQCWAEEFEKANDMKRADQIYIEGLKRNAQPKDELVAAHTNFQVRVARSILGQNPIMNQPSEIEERTALSTLRAHGRKKNMVDSNRVGNSIRRATPGVLRPHANVALADRRNGNVQASKVVVYNDENAPFTDAVAHPVVKTSVSLSQQKTENKENSLKPGRWNEGKFKKKSSASAIGMSGVPATPRAPSFHVHADENAVMPKTPKTDIVASNVLKMRRHVYEDEKNIPIAMFELPDPKKIAMYPKSKVYSGGTEYSLEELRAIIYLKREKERQKQSHENKNVDKNFETQDAELQVSCEEKVVSINGDQNYRSEERHCQQLNIQQEEVCISERTEMKQLCQNNNFEIYMEAEEEMNAKMKQKPLKEFQQKERIPAAAPMQTSFLKDLPASGFLKVPRTILERKGSMVPSTDDMFYSGPSFEQKESDQSLTVNTKAVLNEVKGMWVSSPQAESNPPRVSLAPKSISHGRVDSNSTPLSFTPFKIFSDTSANVPEQASIVNVHFGKEAEGRKMEKEREVEVAEYRKEVSQPGFPQRNPLSRNLFHTPSSNNRHDPEDVEMQAMEQNCESALYKERGIFKSSNQEPTSFPRNSSEGARDQDTHRDDFKIFKVPSAVSVKQDKEMSKPAMEIPFVPSPGMTPGQLEALKGTEDKENVLRGKSEQMPQLSRSKKSILQPSKDVYFVPLEQQLAEDDMSQGNVLSDETCCTEAFAIPLVSSTPMLHPYLKTKVQEAKPNQEEEEVDDNTINLMAYLQQKYIRESVLPANGTNTKPQLVDQSDNVPVLPNSTRMPRMSTVTSQLSTILELSDRRKSSMATIDGSGSSKSSGCDTISKYNNTRKSISSAYHQICELELQEEIDMFRNIDHNQRPSPSGSLMFFSGSFRSRCWESSGFPSEVHKKNCVELHMPFDINIRGGSSFVLGENRYQVFEVISEETGMLSFFAYQDSSKRRVYMELKDNAYLWEQYIREEIKQRVRDKSKLQHFDINDKTYIFPNKFLRVFEKDAKKGRCIKDILEQTFDVTERASEILNIVFHLHQCKIVHGSLSLESFMLISDDLFLNCFEKAVDLTLLPPNTVFDATEEPLYHKLRAHKLSPFQVDYIALANILHQLVFKEPMKVHEEMGKWCISSILPRNYDKTLWDILFTELLNSSDVNLLQFCYALEQGINS